MKQIIFAMAVTLVLTTPTTVAQKASDPESTSAPKEQNRSFDGTPLDPFKEGARVRAKELAQKNHKELKEAAAELLDLSQKLSQDVEAGGENVISARIFDHLDKIEKLTKSIRNKAKSGY